MNSVIQTFTIILPDTLNFHQQDKKTQTFTNFGGEEQRKKTQKLPKKEKKERKLHKNPKYLCRQEKKPKNKL